MGKLVNKDLHQCKKTKPFEFKDDYHYYNPAIFSMGETYYNGHNLRQMNRYAYIIWRLGYGYEQLYKHRLLYGPDKQIDEFLAITKELCTHAHQVYTEISQWRREYRNSKGEVQLGETFASKESQRRHMSPEEREIKVTNARYLRNLDPWGRETAEIVTQEDFKKHWTSFTKSFADEAQLFTSWGHWLTFLFVSDLEGGEDTKLDLANLNQLILKGIKFEKTMRDFKC